MTGASRLLAGIAGAMLLAGCAYPTEPPPESGPEQHAPEVSRSLHDHEVSFPERAVSLPAGERRALLRFLASIRADRRAEIAVSVADDLPEDLGEARRTHVMRVLRAQGYRPEIADPPAAQPPVAGDIGLRVARYHVALPDCPHAPEIRLAGFHNLPAGNFGCATQRNLGAMVAQPRDLLQGRARAPGDGERLSRAVRDYRAGEQPALESADVGGDVGFGQEAGGGTSQ